MTNYIKIVMKNTEPIRIADDSTSQRGQTTTLRYIPGTTIRGLVINALAKEADFEQIKAKLFSYKVRYLNAFIGNAKEEFLPSPKGFYENKVQAEGKKEIQNVVINGNFEDGYKRAALGRYCRIERDCIYYYNVETSSDMKIKINIQDGEKQNVFRNEYISAGHIFTGYIAVEDKILGDRILNIFQDEIILGNARSAGFGKCRILECKYENRIPYEKYFPQRDLENSCYMMLVSNTAMRNELGEISGFTEETLKSIEKKMGVKNLQIAHCATSAVNVKGYNRIWGTKIPSVTMYEQGSVFHLKFEGTLKTEKMRELADCGIGIRKNEGFGRIIFLDQYENVKYKLAEEYFTTDVPKEPVGNLTKEDKEVLHIVARTYYRNIIERKTEKFIVDAVEKESFWDERTSSSQLGNLDALITANRYNPDDAEKTIREYIAHADGKEKNNNRQKQHNSLKKTGEFIENIFRTDLDEIVEFKSKEEGKIMGIPKAELFSEKELKKMKLSLLVNLIRFRNKGEK